MRLGIVSPVLTAVPGAHSAWERAAGIEEVTRVAEEADRLGFHHLTCSEHVAIPAEVAAARGATYWDPVATFGYLAARTTRIRLATQVVVLGYHHPLAIAKRYGTLDRVSGGRLILGLGVGSLEEEFALLGATFEGRGPIADESMAALRVSWGRREPSYQGQHFKYDGWVVEPHAPRESVPMWVGGRTRRSLRRALDLGDGWVPFGLTNEQLRAMLDDTERPSDFEVVLSAGVLDPGSQSEDVATRLADLRDTGATIASVALSAESLEHYLEQLHALVELLPQDSDSPE